MNNSSHVHNDTDQTDATNSTAESAISQEFKNFLADIETLFQATTSLTGDELEAAKNQFNERVAAAKATAENVSDNVAQQARDGIAMVDDYVREQPWKAVAWGAAAGLVLGLIFSRRR